MSSPAVPTKKVHPLLARYLTQLALHPLRTKCFTTGTLSFLQEVIGSNLAGVPARPFKDASPFIRTLTAAHIDIKALKMAIYGFLVSAPLSHFLVSQLQKAFAGKTSGAAKVGQILANNLVVAPIQTAVYLASIAVINGASSVSEIKNTVKGGFFSVIRVQWAVSPISLIIAQKYIPVELWVPYFNAIQFTFGTYFNYRAKSTHLAELKKQKEREDREGEGKGPSQ